MIKNDSSSHENQRLLRPVYLKLSGSSHFFLLALIGAGFALAAMGYWLSSENWHRLWLAYLVAFCFVLSLSLGSLFFVLLQHLTRAGWSVVIRRPAEIYSMNLVTVLLLFLPIAIAVWNGQLYPWAAKGLGKHQADHVAHSSHPDNLPFMTTATRFVTTRKLPPILDEGRTNVILASHPYTDGNSSTLNRSVAEGGQPPSLYLHQQLDALTRSKAAWLSRSAFLTRIAAYFAVWLAIAGYYFRLSRRQDLAVGNVGSTRCMEWTAGPSAIAFGLCLTFASFDLLMSLDPHWYSTMFGVYFFAGCAIGGVALNLLTQQLLQRWQPMPKLLSEEHRRDLGRFLFAFVFFWGYIAFSQYMLLWYANIPETSRWFAVRGASQATGFANSWGYLLLALLLGQFLIPFLGIISRHIKVRESAMYFWTGWLLFFHYLDLYWLVMPELGPHFQFGLMELGTAILVLSLYFFGAYLIARRTSLIAIGDPRLNESANIMDVY